MPCLVAAWCENTTSKVNRSNARIAYIIADLHRLGLVVAVQSMHSYVVTERLLQGATVHGLDKNDDAPREH